MIAQPFPVEPSGLPAGAAVLVSGASFAGLATAYWMHRLGYRVTVVEAASGLRKGGTPVDIEGETISVLARMGMIAAVRARALPPRGLEFKDADDRTVGVLDGGSALDDASNEKYEIHCDDLLDILLAAVERSVEVVFGRSIKHRHQRPPQAHALGARARQAGGGGFVFSFAGRHPRRARDCHRPLRGGRRRGHRRQAHQGARRVDHRAGLPMRRSTTPCRARPSPPRWWTECCPSWRCPRASSSSSRTKNNCACPPRMAHSPRSPPPSHDEDGKTLREVPFSSPGCNRGATFTVSLPVGDARPETGAEARDTAREPAPGNRPRTRGQMTIPLARHAFHKRRTPPWHE